MADISKLELNGTTYNIKASGSIPTSEKGAANGVASLDSTGKVPSSQLPSYVDDVLEYSAKSSFPATGETGKIYVDKSNNKTYRWSGSAYVEISESLALGETDSTAYRGDRGKTAYDHSQVTSGNPHNVTKTDVGLSNVGNFKAVSTVASQGLSDTEKSNARANIGAGTGNGTYSKPSGGIPKTDLASAVQTSLGKADTALQSFTETDPTVPSWAKASSKPSYNSDEISDTNRTHKFATSAQLNQISTNQTNILYNLNNGVKNLIRFVPGVYENNVATFDISSDGVVTVNSSKASTSAISNSYFTLPAGTYRQEFISFGGGDVRIVNATTNERITGSPFTLSSDTLVRVDIFSYAVNTKVVVKPMICTEEAWNQSHDYQSPALPNHDLTTSENEDRFELAKLIDSSNKNQFKGFLMQGSHSSNGVLFTYNADGSVTANGTATGNDAVSSYIGSSVAVDDLRDKMLYIKGPNNSGLASWFWDMYNPDWSDRQIRYNGTPINYAYSYPKTGIWRLIIPVGVTCDNWTFYPMVCSKAAFSISEAYVPYKGTHNTLSLGTIDMNTLTHEGKYFVASVTKTNHHAPKDGYYFVDVYTTGDGDRWQRAYRINEPQYVYQRMMTANTWGTWYVFTGAAVT